MSSINNSISDAGLIACDALKWRELYIASRNRRHKGGQEQYLDGCGVLRMQGLDANEMVVGFRGDQRFVAGAPFGMAWLEGGAVQV